MAPRLDKAKGLERRTMAYQVRLPPDTKIQANQYFKKQLPQQPQQFKKDARPAQSPAPQPASAMSALLSNPSPKYVYARGCLCCPTGITIHTRKGIGLKLVYQPGCEKCLACECRPLEVSEDQPDPWNLFWKLNFKCTFCNALAPEAGHGNVVKEEEREKRSFEFKVWEAFALSDGSDTVKPRQQNINTGTAINLDTDGDLIKGADSDKVHDFNKATNPNETAAVDSGKLAGTAGRSNDDPFASYFNDAGAAAPKDGSFDGSSLAVRANTSRGFRVTERVPVEQAGIGSQIIQRHYGNHWGRALLTSKYFSESQFVNWRDLFGFALKQVLT